MIDSESSAEVEWVMQTSTQHPDIWSQAWISRSVPDLVHSWYDDFSGDAPSNHGAIYALLALQCWPESADLLNCDPEHVALLATMGNPAASMMLTAVTVKHMLSKNHTV
jgi:hypothetical protein